MQFHAGWPLQLPAMSAAPSAGYRAALVARHPQLHESLSAALVEAQTDIEQLRRDRAAAEQRTDAVQQSIKTFWAPELERERRQRLAGQKPRVHTSLFVYFFVSLFWFK